MSTDIKPKLESCLKNNDWWQTQILLTAVNQSNLTAKTCNSAKHGESHWKPNHEWFVFVPDKLRIN